VAPKLTLDGAAVDRVTTYKLLGVHISDDLKWMQHVDAVCSKAASRLHFLKQLARSGAPQEDLLCFYCTVVRPVLEYACPVWHSSLTVAQSDAIELIQKRALRLIYKSDYQSALLIAGVDELQSRREQLSQKFFIRNVLNSDSCLNYLLPEKRDPGIITRLRNPRPYESFNSRTVKFDKSFIPYCVINYL